MNRLFTQSLIALVLLALATLGCATTQIATAQKGEPDADDTPADSVATSTDDADNNTDNADTDTDNDDDPEAGFTPIFDGETLDGWTKVGGNATYEVVDGAIVGGGERINANTFLRTQATYRDFEFRCEFRWVQHSNSGIQYRSHQRPNDQGEEVGRVYGYQYELDPSGRAWTAGLYEESRRGWLQNVQGDDNAHKRDALNRDGWNEIVIRCEGNHLQTWLNGVQVTDYIDDADEALVEGFIALQVHGGHNAQMHWRNLRIKVLGEEDQE